jgi:hypothetical protein
MRQTFKPSVFDLGTDNHRSKSASGTLAAADAVLRNEAPLPVTSDVRFKRCKS